MTTKTNPHKMTVPQISCYMGYDDVLMIPKAQAVRLGKLTIYFSYDNCVAFHTPKAGLVIRENDWGETTEKQLKRLETFIKNENYKRVPGSQFEERMERILYQLGVLD